MYVHQIFFFQFSVSFIRSMRKHAICHVLGQQLLCTSWCVVEARDIDNREWRSKKSRAVKMQQRKKSLTDIHHHIQCVYIDISNNSELYISEMSRKKRKEREKVSTLSSWIYYHDFEYIATLGAINKWASHIDLLALTYTHVDTQTRNIPAENENYRTVYMKTKMKLYFRKKREINSSKDWNFSLSFVASLESISWTIVRALR